jgi:outer membrane protein assembly factor BamB
LVVWIAGDSPMIRGTVRSKMIEWNNMKVAIRAAKYVSRSRFRLICPLLAVAWSFAVQRADADWRQFRGSDGAGVAVADGLPEAWNVDRNTVWKSELTGRGPSSPIVVRDRVVVTASSGSAQDRLHVMAFAADSGRRLWQREFWATGRTLCHPTSAVAAPTPASDGERIYAFFSSNDIVCLDLDGNLQWFRGLTHDYPQAANDVGMSSSPQVAGQTVIVQLESQGDSFAAGLEALSGRTRWMVRRSRAASWASPLAYRDPSTGRDVVLLQSPSCLTAHDVETGRQLWVLQKQCDTIASPVAREGLVYAASDGVTAVRAAAGRVSQGDSEEPAKDDGGQGESGRIAWQENRLAPGAASPIVHLGRLYTVNNSGVLGCADAASGDIHWRLRLKGRFWATPVAAGDRLYLVNSDGLAQVVRLGAQGQIVDESDFGETIQATPAVDRGAIYVRSDRHLWKIADGRGSSVTDE